MGTRRTSATRAKDTDRGDTCQVLDHALADGQLSMAEHGARVASATRAATLGDLATLTADLQTDDAPVRLPELRPATSKTALGRGVLAAIAVVLVAVGAGIGWGVHGVTSAASNTDPGARPDGVAPVVLTPPRQLQSLNGLTGLLQTMKRRFGDTMGYRLLVYPDYGSLDRVDPDDARRKISYTYRGGWGDGEEPSAVGPQERLVDFGAVDVKALIGIFRGAPATLGIRPADVTNAYLILEPSADPSAGDVEVSMYVSSDFGSGFVATNGAGEVKRINRPS